MEILLLWIVSLGSSTRTIMTTYVKGLTINVFEILLGRRPILTEPSGHRESDT